MERLTHLADKVHDAAIALKQLLLALDRYHRKPAGTDRLEVDEEHTAELVTMRGQKRPHAGAVAIGRTRCDEPDIVAEQLIVTHGGNGREHILGRSTIGGGGTALPTVVVILEVIPRANAAAGLLGIVIVLDAQPVAHAVLLVLLFATEQAT